MKKPTPPQKALPPEIADERIDPRQQAARLMGQARTEAKQRAAQANGRKGGRPKGFVVNAETRVRISLTKRARTSRPKLADLNENAVDVGGHDLSGEATAVE